MNNFSKIFLVSQGRLGNQVFQYVAIRSLLGAGAITSPSMRSLGNVFNISGQLSIRLAEKTIEKLIRRLLVPIFLRPLFKCLRFGAYLTERVEQLDESSGGSSGNVLFQRGLFNVAFVDGGYYQNLASLLKPADFLCLKVRDDVLAQANQVVLQATQGRTRPKAVMHVRRGDYLGFKTYGLDDVVLPAAYFARAAALARNTLGQGAELLIVTDDAAWCEAALAELKPFTVVSSTEAVDFALLSMFPVAILSNSTFSLAAACVGPDVQQIIGPEYWFGHSVKRWYPPQIRCSDERFTYV